jgi:hypothetical protein
MGQKFRHPPSLTPAHCVARLKDRGQITGAKSKLPPRFRFNDLGPDIAICADPLGVVAALFDASEHGEDVQRLDRRNGSLSDVRKNGALGSARICTRMSSAPARSAGSLSTRRPQLQKLPSAPRAPVPAVPPDRFPARARDAPAAACHAPSLRISRGIGQKEGASLFPRNGT